MAHRCLGLPRLKRTDPQAPTPVQNCLSLADTVLVQTVKGRQWADSVPVDVGFVEEVGFLHH